MTNDEKFERRKQIAEAVKSGKTVAQVARHFRVTGTTVMRACYEFEVRISTLKLQPTPSAA